MANADDLESWLVEQGPHMATMRAVLAALGRRLNDAGVPLDRVSISQATLHPETVAVNYQWLSGDSEATRQPIPHGVELTSLYLESPFRIIYEGGTYLRRQLERPLEADEFPMMAELRDDGYTDYAAMALRFAPGRLGAIAFGTRRPGGFENVHIRQFARLLPALAVVAEVHAARRTTASLLDIYLGPATGGRILTGQIRRGSGETIHAVLWYCDLRDFTEISNRLPLDAIIRLLNEYFEAMAEPVHAHGGEVLKLIGDGMLAVWRLPPGDDARQICYQALAAANLAVANIRRVNRRRLRDGEPELRFGLALHIGEVMYGNVGAPMRLDFTVIGPAVNLAARLEKLAGDLGHAVLASAAFAERAGGDLVHIATHELRGIDTPQPVYAPRPPRRSP